ncbi:MAG: T9SS type A sorting domain-containing protein, partial [Dysgonamonadaceae bacterium]|nr:T9SS type A sorting domain-containing protein [Dysgonamonadaceae bacterium]
ATQVNCPPDTGIDTVEKATYAVYPNPATTTLSLSTTENISSLAVVNVKGQRVMEPKVSKSISIESLAAGVYVLEIHTQGATQFVKFIKK